jgi:TetR/AcrR family transcriptional repressor of nem operon
MTPRQKTYDPVQALDQAMQLFWEKGYEATSIHDLVERLGINRRGLYESFGDKQQLFTKALDRYRSLVVATLFQPLGEAEEPIAAIRDFFRRFEASAGFTENRIGCFAVNSLVELAPHHGDLVDRATKHFEYLEEALERALRRAQEKGEIDAREPARERAAMLVALAQGLCVMGKSTCDEESIRGAVRSALAVVDSWACH